MEERTLNTNPERLYMTVRRILEDLCNAQRCNMGNPEDYIELCSLEEAMQRLRQMVGELKIAEPQDRYYTSRIDQEAHYENLRWNEALDSVMEKMR